MATQATLPRCPVCGLELPEHVLELQGDGFCYCPRSNCGVQLEQLDSDLRVRTYRLAGDYSICLLPFSLAGRNVEDVAASLERSPRWRRRVFSLNNAQDVERTEYFLPYVRRFLFPTLFQPSSVAGGIDEARLSCRHYEFDLSQLGELTDGCLPLLLQCQDRRKAMDYSYRVKLEMAGLVLFGLGVGFLVLRFSTDDEDATYFDQMNALSYLRMIAPLYPGFRMPRITLGETECLVMQLLGCLMSELSAAGAGAASPGEVSRDAPLPVKPTYDDRMMVYYFSCLDKMTGLTDQRLSQRLLRTESLVNFERSDDRQGADYEPDEGEESWMHGRWQGFTKDGGGLVVFNTDRFHERFIGLYTGTYYFDIFLLAVLQRVTLLELFERLSDIPALTKGGSASRRLLRRVRKDLLMFKNQCWFSQITNRERGLVLWRKWQETLENRTLLEEVNEQSEELDNYLQSRTRERVELLVRMGGFLAAAVPGILGIEVLLGKYEWIDQLKWILLALVMVGCGAFAWIMLLRLRED